MKVISATNSILNHFLAELRAVDVQQDSMRFRRNMERIGEIMAYEISKTFIYQPANIVTPLGTCKTTLITQQPLLAAVLRAGLPLHQGFLNYFDKAESAFIAAYRNTSLTDHSFDIRMDYLATPKVEGRILIAIDPMLATGKSLLKTYQTIIKQGKPASVHIAAVIASRQGIEFINRQIPEATVWAAAIDEQMNDKSYIIPGIGDAGDLAFGTKM